MARQERGTGAAKRGGMTSTTATASEPAAPMAAPSSRSVSLAVGRRIVDDDVIGRPQTGDPFLAGETVYAHTKLASFRDGFLEHVWKRDGVEVLREVMPIGEGRCWRTWSYHRVESGDYTVEVFVPDGKRLAWRAFTAF
jgi:DUF2914 family protein